VVLPKPISLPPFLWKPWWPTSKLRVADAYDHYDRENVTSFSLKFHYQFYMLNLLWTSIFFKTFALTGNTVETIIGLLR
jgi:hypothetical protein